MTIVILGGGIAQNGQLPEHVKKRLKMAWQVLKKNKDAKILVCGKYSFLYPKNKLPKKTESQAMRDYLLEMGIPKKNIYLENKSKDSIGNAYYAKKLYFIPKKEGRGIIITSEFHLARVKFIFKKIFGNNYKFKFIGVPFSLKNKRGKKIIERQKELLEKIKEILNKMELGDHNFLRGKLYKLKYYRKKRPPWVIEFVTKGK